MQTTDFEFIRITAQYPQAGKESNKPEKEIPGWLKTLIIILFIEFTAKRMKVTPQESLSLI
ncbi:MAG: hypothetical protein HON91_07940 [Anaerolineae bacterium]|nr:hypothetical protein [Anaerolineae bacterium]